MSVYLHSTGSFKSVINNNIIDDVNWNAEYDGANLDVIANNKNKQVFLKLDNSDIEELLKLNSHHNTVERNLRNSLKNKDNDMFSPVYIVKKNSPGKKKRCPNGTRKNKKTHRCESKVKSRTPTPYYPRLSKTRKTTKTKTKNTPTPDILKTIY